MKFRSLHSEPRRSRFSILVSLLLAVVVLAAPLRAQQPPQPPARVTTQTESQNDPTFDNLLSADSYKMYGEVRNVGTLLTTGGAGEIVEPIMKLANPGAEFNAIVGFLKKNSEALASSRLMFATWPARTGIPNLFVAIEFATKDEAAKFAPRLETFLPTVLPSVPVEPEAKTDKPAPPKPAEQNESAAAKPSATPPAEIMPTIIVKTPPNTAAATPPVAKPEMRLPFVITHSGSLVFISEKPFKLESLRSKSVPPLAEDNNFRVARDRFSAEPVFLFFNVELEDKTKPKPSPTPVISEEEQERIRQEDEARIKQLDDARAEQEKAAQMAATPEVARAETIATLTIRDPSPKPTPTKEQEARTVASSQIGNMMSMLGQGEPQLPEAIGVALALDNDQYVVRAILIDSENSKRLTLPFIPQLIAGPANAAEAPTILPDDTEVFVSTSIDFAQTYNEMKKQAEVISSKNANQYIEGRARASLDSFAEFEKKAGFKISDDLLPVLGNELAVATTLQTMNMLGVFGMPPPPPPSAKSTDAGKENTPEAMPIFLVAIKDREGARRLMPRVLEGLGMGAANLLAQTERRGESEIVSYAGIFSYAFVGNFLVVSDSATVRRIADANANRQTLSSNNAFRNSRRWQPRLTRGEIYISPKMMEGYQEQVGKMAGTMDQGMRDFLLQLSPASSAITYALSHDGLGTQHELHLPKNLILAMVAGTSASMAAMKQGSPDMNEMIAISSLQVLAQTEETYKSSAGKGKYGTLDELIGQKLLAREMFEKYGYNFNLTVSGSGFTATTVPTEYGKTGKRSFFVDQTGIVRGDDHGGGPASSADKQVQ